MAGLVAWLWSFPLFGTLQESLIIKNTDLISWNVAFLSGLALVFLLSSLSLRVRDLQKKVFRHLPYLILIINIAIVVPSLIAAPGSLSQSPQYFNIIYNPILPLALGGATASFFVIWGSTLYLIPRYSRGCYMSLMMSLSVLGLLFVILISWYSLILSFLIICLYILISGLLIPGMTELLAAGARQKSGKVPKTAKALLTFWLPFTLILLCYNFLSGFVHHTIFPLIRQGSFAAQLLGPLFYGLTALTGGYFLDKRVHPGVIASTCLALLGLSFLFLPLAVKYQLLIPLQIFLESSYALVDLFIWYTPALAACHYGLNPVIFYGRALFFNIAFTLLGMGADSLIIRLIDSLSFFYLAITAGALLFIGIFPALLLFRFDQQPTIRKLPPSITPQHFRQNIEKLTPKEQELLGLILGGLENTNIQSQLGISKNTLKTHIRNLYSKVQVKNRSELILKYSEYFNNKKSPP